MVGHGTGLGWPKGRGIKVASIRVSDLTTTKQGEKRVTVGEGPA